MTGNSLKRPYDPESLLFEAQKEPDVKRSVIARPTPPGFRKQPVFRVPLNDLLTKVILDHREKSNLWFTYTPLEPGRVRLLIIRPGQFDDPLELDIVSVSLDRLPQYKALSYEWGDGPDLNTITLRDYIQRSSDFTDSKKKLRFILFRHAGTKFSVRRNLYEALRHLRSTKDAIKMWVDAICINQQDDDERTEQIKRMNDIYNRAFNVNIWLGIANETSDGAMDFIGELVQFQKLKAIFLNEASWDKWPALVDLMCSRWFSRRWVIQELALSRAASVHCGKKVVHWDDFAVAISIFTTRLPWMRSQGSNKELKFKPEALNFVEALGARELVKVTSDLLKKSSDGKIMEKYSTLDYLVSTLVSFDAGDPRDTIYALLSISRGNPHQDLQPNYKKGLLEVYTDFVKSCIESSNSLDIICRHWAPVHTTLIVNKESSGQRRIKETIKIETALPSWISQLDKSAFGTPDKIFRGRKNADSLVGLRRVYNASGSSGVTLASFGEKLKTRTPNKSKGRAAKKSNQGPSLIESYDGTLKVQGLVMGRVETLSPRIMPGKLPQEVLEMGGWNYALRDEARAVDEVPDELWKTLVANKDHNGITPDPLYRHACLEALQKADVSGDVDIEMLCRPGPDSDEEVASFLKRAQQVVWNRKVFVGGVDRELFGLCSKETREGDLICILYGCSVPVVLRGLEEIPKLGQRFAQQAEPCDRSQNSRTVPRINGNDVRYHANKDTEQTVCYRVIGECYTHGRMEGEALDHPEYKYQNSEQMFVLV